MNDDIDSFSDSTIKNDEYLEVTQTKIKLENAMKSAKTFMLNPKD